MQMKGFMEAALNEYEIIPPVISTAGVYLFTTDSGVHYEVRFGRRQDNILHAIIVFGVTNDEYEGEEYTVTNRGEVYRVMNTIVRIVKLFMKEHPNITCYEFTGLAREGEDDDKTTVRINLYKRYLPRIFDNNWHYLVRGNTILVCRTRP